MKHHFFNRRKIGILTIILVIALAARIYKITAPLADFHSWRQADTAAVARNFERNGFNLLKPQYDDLSSIQSGAENPNGYRFVEFPLYNALFATTHRIFPFLSLEVWGRIISVLFSLLAIFSLYYIVGKEAGELAGTFSAITYAIMPFFVFFSRTILPDTPALSSALLAILFLLIFEKEKKRFLQIIFFLTSSLFLALAVLMKPTAVFYTIPLIILFGRKYTFTIPRQLHIVLYFIIAFTPFILWRYYISRFPEGIPASKWLISQVNTFEGEKEIFMRPAFFRWIFFERINNLILGGYLTLFMILGMVRKKNTFFLMSLIATGFVYVFIFQGGNVQHEYYQILLFPSLAVAIGAGVANFLEQQDKLYRKAVAGFLVFALFGASFFFSWFLVKGYYTIPQDMLFMAKIVQTFTKPNDKIIIDRMGDTTVLYLSDRKGAPLLYKPIEELEQQGYSYILTDKQEIIKQLKEKEYIVLFENNQFALFSL